VLVPFLQAFVIGVCAGLILTWLLVDVAKTAGSWWPSLGLAVVACFGLAFVSRVSSVEGTLWTVERVIGRDITGDKIVGPPPHDDHIIIAGPNSSTLTKKERKRAQFIEFLRGCEATGDTGHQRWAPKLGRSRYEEFRDALIAGGVAEWRNPDNHRVGWSLTYPADEIIRRVWSAV